MKGFLSSVRRRMNTKDTPTTSESITSTSESFKTTSFQQSSTLTTSTSALNNNIDNTDKDLSRTESYRQYNNNNNSFIVNPLSLRIQNNNNSSNNNKLISSSSSSIGSLKSPKLPPSSPSAVSTAPPSPDLNSERRNQVSSSEEERNNNNSFSSLSSTSRQNSSSSSPAKIVCETFPADLPPGTFGNRATSKSTIGKLSGPPSASSPSVRRRGQVKNRPSSALFAPTGTPPPSNSGTNLISDIEITMGEKKSSKNSSAVTSSSDSGSSKNQRASAMSQPDDNNINNINTSNINNNNNSYNNNDNAQTGRDNTNKDGSESSTAKIISSGDKQQTSGQEPSPAESPPELVMFDETKKRIEPTEKKVVKTDEEVAQMLYETSSPSRKARTPTGLLVAQADPNVFAKLGPLLSAPAPERAELFRLKVRACGALVFDFRANAIDALVIEKDAKRETLTELVDFMTNSKSVVTEQLIDDAVSMVSANIFRPLPPPVAAISGGIIPSIHDAEDVEPALEPGWSHLQLVYEFFLRCVMSNDITPKVIKRYIDAQFILKFLDLFTTDDPRERDYLKTILHRIYGKLMPLRTFIRKAIQHVFYRFIYEDDSANGISELLEILGSIINGFALPLKDEHKTFLDKSMIPLHKPKGLMSYHQQLAYCMTQYIDKEAKLAESIIWGLLRFWPVTNTPKEILFLHELEEILELTQPAEFKKVMEPLMKRLATCIQSPHFQISERVLYLWNNEYVAKLINQNRQQLFPIIISALYKNTREHWNPTVHQLTLNVSKILADADPALFEACSDQNIQNEEKKRADKISRESRWQQLKQQYQESGAQKESKAGEIVQEHLSSKPSDQ